MRFDSLGNICTTVTDYVANGSFKALKENVSHKNAQDGYAILIRLADYRNKFKGPFEYIDRHGYNFLSKTKLYGNEIIISNVGAHLGTVFRTPTLGTPMSLGPNAILLKTKYIDDYYYYFFTSKKGQALLKTIVSGSAQPKFNKTDLKKLIVPVPSLDEQNKISRKLLAIDKKIQINEQINANLLNLANTLFKHYFPDINTGTDKIGDYIKNFDKLRKPLSKKQRSEIPGKYRYIGATSVNDHIDKYNFDGIYLLLGEDGTVQDEYGFPILQYTFGKFWPNNHAHVLQGKNVSTEWLYLYFSQRNISGIVTGAVQKKVSQKNMNSLKFKLPDSQELKKFDKIIQPLFSKIRSTKLENYQLEELKRVLLTKLF